MYMYICICICLFLSLCLIFVAHSHCDSSLRHSSSTRATHDKVTSWTIYMWKPPPLFKNMCDSSSTRAWQSHIINYIYVETPPIKIKLFDSSSTHDKVTSWTIYMWKPSLYFFFCVTPAWLARFMAHHDKVTSWSTGMKTIKKNVWLQLDSHDSWRIITKSIMILYIPCGKKNPIEKQKIVWPQFDSRGSWRIMTLSHHDTIHTVWEKKTYRKTKKNRDSSSTRVAHGVSWQSNGASWYYMYVEKKNTLSWRAFSRASRVGCWFFPHIYIVSWGFVSHICIVSWCIIIVYRCGKTHCDKIGVRLVLPPSRCLPRICLNTKGIRGRHLFQSQPWILPFFSVCLIFARCLSRIFLLDKYEVDTKEIRSKYLLVFASRPIKGRHLFACRQIRGRHQANTRQRPISKKKLLVSEYRDEADFKIFLLGACCVGKYGVATVSRIDKMTGLFWRISSLL